MPPGPKTPKPRRGQTSGLSTSASKEKELLSNLKGQAKDGNTRKLLVTRAEQGVLE